jgi:hypothetical protein
MICVLWRREKRAARKHVRGIGEPVPAASLFHEAFRAAST